MSTIPICPKCNRRLYFSGDGRTLTCDHCDYTQSSGKEDNFSVKDLIEMERMGKQSPQRESGSRTAARIFLSDGDAALKAERQSDAYFAYGFVLKTEATDEERALAWLGLSFVFEDPKDRRQCLEYALLNFPQLATASREMAILEGRLKRSDIIDPNRLEQAIDEAPIAITPLAFDCPQCSASIQHDPELGRLFCQFCGFEGDAEALQDQLSERQFGEGPFEQQFIAALATAKGHLNPVQQRTFGCGRCGTQFVLDASTLSMTCPYCEADYVTEAAETEALMAPSAMLPFAVSQTNAHKLYKSWLKQTLSKRQRGQLKRIHPLNGLYLPLWTFDIGGSVTWKGFIEENDRKIPVSGTEFPFFDDVIVMAGDHNNGRIREITRLFDTKEVSAYQPEFMAGWPAERYTLALGDAAIQARKQVVQQFRRQPHRLTKRRGIQQFSFKTSQLIVESFKLLYLPLWIGHYELGDETFEVYINGSTGEIRAETPRGLVSRLFSVA